jgi:hypothetical protein
VGTIAARIPASSSRENMLTSVMVLGQRSAPPSDFFIVIIIIIINIQIFGF